MDRLAIIFGLNSASANNIKPTEVVDGLRATQANIYSTVCDTNPALRHAVDQTIVDLATKSDGTPSMLLAIANGRDAQGQQPAQLYGGHDDLEMMLKQLVKEAQQRKALLDVFMLTTGNISFIHSYAQQLPEGSTVVAAATWQDSVNNGNFWDMLKQPNLHRAVPLNARSMLLHLLLGGNETQGLVEIAVSGKPRISLSRMWHEMVAQGGVKPAAHQELEEIAGHMNPKFVLDYEASRDMIAKKPFGLSPLGNSFYACAVASTWDSFYGTVSAAHAPAQAPPPIAARVQSRGAASSTPTGTMANSTPAASRKARPTNSDIGGMWQVGKKPWQQNPLVIKRLMRKI